MNSKHAYHVNVTVYYIPINLALQLQSAGQLIEQQDMWELLWLETASIAFLHMAVQSWNTQWDSRSLEIQSERTKFIYDRFSHLDFEAIELNLLSSTQIQIRTEIQASVKICCEFIWARTTWRLKSKLLPANTFAAPYMISVSSYY